MKQKITRTRLAEEQRKREEQKLIECTFHPKINL